MSKRNDLDRRAHEAINKAAAIGEDIDIDQYGRAVVPEREYLDNPGALSTAVKQELLKAGIEPSGKDRSGTFIQIDHSVVHTSVVQSGLEVMSTVKAREKYSWLDDYRWRAIEVDTDKFTARAHLEQHHGYFLRAMPGVKGIYPLQACLFMAQPDITQNVHNIIIAEENSELHVITGCARAPEVEGGIHIGVSEFYVKKGARITFTMVHNWAPNMFVRPRTGVIVEEGGIFVSNYICMQPVRSVQMYPSVQLVGRGATARFASVLVSTPGSMLDIGAKIILGAPETRGEIISRAVSTGGKIIARGLLVGEVPGVKAHLECRGLLLNKRAFIHAIPELVGKVAGVDLSHEAAVGKIAQEEIEYLMSRGLSEEEATAVIVRGFLNVEIQGLPEALANEMHRIIELGEQSVL